MPDTIWIDIEDVLVHLARGARPTGIQRLTFEATSALLALAGPARIRLMRYAAAPTGYREIAHADFAALYAAAVAPPYILFVSTIEIRKNHALLFRAWRRLLDDIGPDRLPILVFAGAIGWIVDDLMQQIRNAGFLGGKLLIIESPSDATLEALYRNALFTVYPSHYEGWGLPVVESHAFGTPCLAARATSLPEAGGTLARYFTPDDPADLCRAIRHLIDNPADLDAWRAELRATFRPTPWHATAEAILAAIDAPPPIDEPIPPV